jgi:hypothetical protein
VGWVYLSNGVLTIMCEDMDFIPSTAKKGEIIHIAYGNNKYGVYIVTLYKILPYPKFQPIQYKCFNIFSF